MQTNFEKVVDFNKQFGVKTYDSPQYDIFTKDPHLVKLRMDLIREEVRELDESINMDDYVECLDALCDIAYVVYGMACSFGSNLDNTFVDMWHIKVQSKHDKIPDLNFTNFYRVVYLLNDGNIKWTSEPKTSIIRDNRNIVDLCLGLVKEHLEELEDSVKNEDYDRCIKDLADLIYDVYSFGFCIGINMDEAFAIVHDNNMSKLCSSENEAERTVIYYNDNFDKLGYDSPGYRLAPDRIHWVVFNQSSGKVLKSISWKPVDLSSYIENFMVDTME